MWGIRSALGPLFVGPVLLLCMHGTFFWLVFLLFPSFFSCPAVEGCASSGGFLFVCFTAPRRAAAVAWGGPLDLRVFSKPRLTSLACFLLLGSGMDLTPASSFFHRVAYSPMGGKSLDERSFMVAGGAQLLYVQMVRACCCYLPAWAT